MVSNDTVITDEILYLLTALWKSYSHRVTDDRLVRIHSHRLYSHEQVFLFNLDG